MLVDKLKRRAVVRLEIRCQKFLRISARHRSKDVNRRFWLCELLVMNPASRALRWQVKAVSPLATVTRSADGLQIFSEAWNRTFWTKNYWAA